MFLLFELIPRRQKVQGTTGMPTNNVIQKQQKQYHKIVAYNVNHLKNTPPKKKSHLHDYRVNSKISKGIDGYIKQNPRSQKGYGTLDHSTTQAAKIPPQWAIC